MAIVKVEAFALRKTPTLKRALSHGQLVYGDEGDLLGKPVLVRITDDSGAVGTGQMRPLNPWMGETTEAVLVAIRDYFGPALLGRDPRDRTAIYADLAERLPNTQVALCVVDLALWDLMGQLSGQPVAALLGGTVDAAIPMEWSVGLADPAQMVEEAQTAVERHGVEVVCMKVGRERWQTDVEVFQAVRDAVGPDIRLGIDANEGYDEATTVRVLRALDGYDVGYLEQPLPRNELDGLARLRMKLDVPIFVDESVFTPEDALRVARAGACDTIVLKLYKCGGITGAQRVAQVAAAAGIGVNVGGTAQGSQLEAAAAAHLCVSLANHVFAAEFIMGLAAVEADPLFDEPLVDFADGVSRLRDAPGFGATLTDEDIERQALVHHVVGAVAV
ncbi:MAG TPA: enolase C-terminal domain-like protein [Baekduia sp.]|nr:enolase C-terminal domain-like protein [Baekduia sp.]